MEKSIHANGNRKKAGVATLTSDKIDSQRDTVTRDKKGHYIMLKGSSQPEYITVNISIPNLWTCKYIQQILINIEGETDSNTIKTASPGYQNQTRTPQKKNFRPISLMDKGAQRNPQQNIRKNFTNTLKGLFTMVNWDLSQGYSDGWIFANQSNVIHHMNEWKNKNHVIISTEKTFGKFQCPFIIQSLGNLPPQ